MWNKPGVPGCGFPDAPGITYDSMTKGASKVFYALKALDFRQPGRLTKTIDAFQRLADRPLGPDSPDWEIDRIRVAHESWRLETRGRFTDSDANTLAIIGGRIGQWISRAWTDDVKAFGSKHPPLGILSDWSTPRGVRPARSPYGELVSKTFLADWSAVPNLRSSQGSPFGWNVVQLLDAWGNTAHHPLHPTSWPLAPFMKAIDTWNTCSRSLIETLSSQRCFGDVEHLLLESSWIVIDPLKSGGLLELAETRLCKIWLNSLGQADRSEIWDESDRASMEKDWNLRIFFGRMLGIMFNEFKKARFGLTQADRNTPWETGWECHAYSGKGQHGLLAIDPKHINGLPDSVRPQAVNAAKFSLAVG